MAIKAQISNVRLSQLLCQQFLKTCSQFHVYFDYCNAYYNSIDLLNSLCKQRTGLENYLHYLSRDPRSNGLDLSSYLIKPVQVRIIWKTNELRFRSLSISFDPYHSSLIYSVCVNIHSSSLAYSRTWNQTIPSDPISKKSTPKLLILSPRSM